MLRLLTVLAANHHKAIVMEAWDAYYSHVLKHTPFVKEIAYAYAVGGCESFL